MYSGKTLALAVAPFLLAVHASVDLDMNDVPASCKTICSPVSQLSDKCATDLLSSIDRDEKLLEAQCVCTNKSFNVARIAALCADCMRQSTQQVNNDDDVADLEDISNLIATCGFSSIKYSTAATTEAQNITVVATAATDIKQLTTTLTGSAQPPVQTSGSVSASASASITSGPARTSSGGSSGMPSGATTAISSRSSSVSGSRGSATATWTVNAAPGVQPLGGVSAAGVLYVAGAFVDGGWMMLQ
ncbi:Protein CAP22 [Tolypocladium ophioglossoides CBS 100239]|uniref:Protein CAP22 n=1 Tax=Tolypocladium ophioglossoides (strain CBS 100239) TaxID=1163406 RepID=A0A0L0NI09_TOLOC|nr:Protein CAP22 [Tolypocladium ophioglossoides CBS 100239]